MYLSILFIIKFIGFIFDVKFLDIFPPPGGGKSMSVQIPTWQLLQMYLSILFIIKFIGLTFAVNFLRIYCCPPEEE